MRRTIVAASMLALAGCSGGAANESPPGQTTNETPVASPPIAASREPVATQRPDTPAQDVLTTLRLAVEAELAQPVRIDVDERRGNERWTFITGVARTRGGKAIDYTATRYAADIEDGVFDDWLCALLEKDGQRWRVVALEIGATDVPFVDWPDRYGVPPDIVLP